MVKTKTPEATTTGTGAGADKPKKTSKSRSQKAGLIFPVSKTHRKCNEKKTTKRVGASAPVYIAAVVEFLASEIFEISGAVASADKSRKRITPRDVLQAVRTDKELNKMTKGLRVLVGDKIKDASGEILTTKAKAEKKAQKKKK